MPQDNRVDVRPGETWRLFAADGQTLVGGTNKSKRSATIRSSGAYLDPDVEPPPVEPPPAGKVVTLSNSDGQAAYLQAVRDMTVDRIKLVAEAYRWDKIAIDVDRTARPLTTQGVAGTKFIGNGATSEGVFFLGLSKVAKALSFEDFAVDDVLLSQAGVFEVRASDGITLRRITMTNLRRDPRWSDKAGKTWGVYLSGSGSGGAGNKNFLAEDVSVSPRTYRDVGAIQMDSSPAQSSNIVLRRIKVARCDYAFYGAVPVTGLILDDWDVTDSSNPNGTAIRFTATKISGRYSNIRLVSSGIIHNSSTGQMVAA